MCFSGYHEWAHATIAVPEWDVWFSPEKAAAAESGGQQLRGRVQKIGEARDVKQC
jgi:hypothetical protein